MRTTKSSLARCIISILAGLAFVPMAPAQTVAQKKELLGKVVNAFSKVPEAQKKILSSGGQNFFALATRLSAPATQSEESGVAEIPRTAQAKAGLLAPIELAFGPGGLPRVSDPALDFLTSVTAGFTQSETSTAWCGNNVVVGYNDSGAFLRTFEVNPQAATSTNGVSASANGGRSFRDFGFLNPGANPANMLQGDPVVFCTSATHFYYSSLLETATTDSQGNLQPITAVSLSASSNGGATWANPVIAIGKDGFVHFLDKPWSTYDPANPQRMYVTYTDMDFSLASTACPGHVRIAIEMVSSKDGGATWSAPAPVDEECGTTGNTVQGSNVQVAADGSVFVAFEFTPFTGNPEIRIARSVNHGATFGAPVQVATGVVPNGATGALQGIFRNNEFPQLAIDRSPGPAAGTVYVVWSDGRDNIAPDVITGTYAYPDVMIAKSTDHGRTFSAPEPVSPTPRDFFGMGRDQFFPSVAVDRAGRVGVCYYDRRGSSDNTVIDRFCSLSVNHGRSWNEQRISFANWLPNHDTDSLINPIYIGDYDALTTDALGINSGFFGAFEIQNRGNPDVYAKRF
jgi:hypothetical protein